MFFVSGIVYNELLAEKNTLEWKGIQESLPKHLPTNNCVASTKQKVQQEARADSVDYDKTFPLLRVTRCSVS